MHQPEFARHFCLDDPKTPPSLIVPDWIHLLSQIHFPCIPQFSIGSTITDLLPVEIWVSSSWFLLLPLCVVRYATRSYFLNISWICLLLSSSCCYCLSHLEYSCSLIAALLASVLWYLFSTQKPEYFFWHSNLFIWSIQTLKIHSVVFPSPSGWIQIS